MDKYVNIVENKLIKQVKRKKRHYLIKKKAKVSKMTRKDNSDDYYLVEQKIS